MNPEWFAANQANWDERVPIHLQSYGLAGLRAGRGRLHPIEDAEFTVTPGERILHLQCHFGRDTLTLAQRGAIVTGVDFSPPAIAAARSLAAELSLDARFVECNVYDAPAVLPEPASFDSVFVTWGAINWLPGIEAWASVAAHFTRPGGRLYLAEGHPAAYVFESPRDRETAFPEWFAPYFRREATALDDDRDYSDPNARLRNTRTYEWIHPLGTILSALLAAGFTIEQFAEHDALPWRMFANLIEGGDGLFRWPGEAWLPLAFSLTARRNQP
jgi:SAM-dependent methyltransferase